MKKDVFLQVFVHLEAKKHVIYMENAEFDENSFTLGMLEARKTM